jgi:hypothetical protein
MIPEGSNIEEAKHSQLFGHTDTVTPGRSKDELGATSQGIDKVEVGSMTCKNLPRFRGPQIPIARR